MAIEFIYDPEYVVEVLNRHPALSQKLGRPEQEGRKSGSFPNARITGRQIYRILSNANYPHLTHLLRTLEYCLSNGWDQPALLRTSGGMEFESTVSELYLAEAFLRNGFTVHCLDKNRGANRVPDMCVQADGFSLVVEVYSPRDWDGLNRFEDELRLRVLHLDAPWDFSFEIGLLPMTACDPSGRQQLFDPWQFSKAADEPDKRFRKMEPILNRINEGLMGPAKPQLEAQLPDEALNVLVTVRLENIQRSRGHIPSRSGSVRLPTLTGHAPEGMFEGLVTRRIREKLGKGQAQSLSGSHLRALIVDVSGLGYVDEFGHPWYREKFRHTLNEHLDLAGINIDLVLFCLVGPRAGPRMRPLLDSHKSSFPDSVLDRLLSSVGC
ncbi:MAG TPA: hypothetical protein VL486_16055 [Verrucomicrobiae bacterium]|nr:hypothetical protein [Verrucomicrobiae bacterium]